MSKPTISIITVVFNSATFIEGTIRSIANQTWPHIEYIIVDGGSTDGTVDIIRQNAHHITHWVSEKDSGLYDAMNKGLRMATGQFVWFVNAGDQIFEPDSVEKIFSACPPDADILYGEVMIVDGQRQHLGTRSQLTTKKLPTNLTWKSLRRGMVVCHQGFIVRRALAPFFIENNLAADIDWVIACLKKSRRTVHTGLVLAEYLTGGISKKRHRQSLRGRWETMVSHFGFWATARSHLVFVLEAGWLKIRRFGEFTY